MYQIDIWLELNFLFKTINGLLIRLILTDFAITNEIGGEFGWNFRFGFPQNSSFHTCASLWIFWCNPRCKSSVGSSHDRSFKLIVTWVASLFSKVVEYWVDQSTFGSFRFQIHKIPHFFYFQLPKPLNPRVTSKHPIITQTRLKHQSCNLQQKTTPLSGFIWFILIHHYEIYKNVFVKLLSYWLKTEIRLMYKMWFPRLDIVDIEVLYLVRYFLRWSLYKLERKATL